MFILDQYFFDRLSEKANPRFRMFFTMTAHVYFLLVLLYIVPCIYALATKNYLLIVELSLMGGIGGVIGAILKALILRPRPNNFITYLGKTDSAFPSSHTLIAVGLAYILSAYFPSLLLVFVLIACLVGLGRIYIQMHYLTDVIGGLLIGLGIAHLILLVTPLYV
ncbi:phosphatase PAP2 family protein [Candidatus Gracilibacteria bacterium]|nr:phosphatase PAP2 family protein [Candidatus Gracilibacteria bacterium]